MQGIANELDGTVTLIRTQVHPQRGRRDGRFHDIVHPGWRDDWHIVVETED